MLYFLARQLFDRVMTLPRRAALLAPFIAILPLAVADAADPPATPSAVVAQAPASAWRAVPAQDLLVMTIEGGKRVLIQLAPQFGPRHVANIRALATAHWWDGTSINRVQDNYVVQWGDANAEDKAKAKKLPGDLAVVPESEYSIDHDILLDRVLPKDSYGVQAGIFAGWPLAFDDKIWPVHCYGMVGVGRDMPPNTGTGAELYTVIGHAPRHLDRNIALVGRVIEGIEHLSSLPRGTGALGFYETPEERTGIVSIRIGNEVSGLPGYEYLSTESESFARYADARANRRDAFFIRPAGGADVCNVPVPVRRVK